MFFICDAISQGILAAIILALCMLQKQSNPLPTEGLATVSSFYGPGAFGACLLTAGATAALSIAGIPRVAPDLEAIAATLVYAGVATGDALLRLGRGATPTHDAQLAAALAVCA